MKPFPTISISQFCFCLLLLDFLFLTRMYALSNLVELILFLFFLLHPEMRKAGLRALRHPVVKILAATSGWFLLSSLWSESGLFEGLVDWVSWRKLFLVPIGVALLDSKKRVYLALGAFLSVCVFYLLLSIFALTQPSGELWSRNYGSIMQNDNVQGMAFCVSGLFLVVASVAHKNLSIFCRLGEFLIGACLLMWVVMVGESKSGYVAFFSGVSALCYCFILARGETFNLSIPRAAVVFATITAVVVLILGISPVALYQLTSGVQQIIEGTDCVNTAASSGSIRTVMWIHTLEIFIENFLFGTGAGGFEKAYIDIVASEGYPEGHWCGTATDDPHQQYLHIGSEYGLIGLLLYLGYLLSLWMLPISDPSIRCLRYHLLLTIILVGFFNGVFGGSVFGRIFALLTSVIISWSEIEKTGRRSLA